MAKQRLTLFGIEVKKKLLDMNVTQAEFCRKHGIPNNRFSEILTGSRQNFKYREQIKEILDIKGQ